MADFEKMYYRLFNAITDALRSLDADDLSNVKTILIKAQCETEEMFIEAE